MVARRNAAITQVPFSDCERRHIRCGDCFEQVSERASRAHRALPLNLDRAAVLEFVGCGPLDYQPNLLLARLHIVEFCVAIAEFSAAGQIP